MNQDDQRKLIYVDNRNRCEQLAIKAVSRGYKTNDFIILVIDIDDKSWYQLVDILTPNVNWNKIRKHNEKLIGRIVVTRDVSNYISASVPDIESSLNTQVDDNSALVVVCAYQGASVYLLQFKLN